MENYKSLRNTYEVFTPYKRIGNTARKSTNGTTPINHGAGTMVRRAYALLTYGFFGTISFTMRLINTPFFHITKYMHVFKAGCDEIPACVLKDLEEQK